MQPDAAFVARVEAMFGRRTSGWRRTTGGYTPAARWVATFADGTSAFLKAGTTDATSEWLRREHRFYSHVRGAYLARLNGWDDDGRRPILALEDLSGAAWPPPWNRERVDGVLHALAEVAVDAPAGRHADAPRARGNGWRLDDRGADPAPFLSLGMCSAAWLANCTARATGCRGQRPNRRHGPAAPRHPQRQRLLRRGANADRRLEPCLRRQCAARCRLLATESRVRRRPGAGGRRAALPTCSRRSSQGSSPPGQACRTSRTRRSCGGCSENSSRRRCPGRCGCSGCRHWMGRTVSPRVRGTAPGWRRRLRRSATARLTEKHRRLFDPARPIAEEQRHALRVEGQRARPLAHHSGRTC